MADNLSRGFRSVSWVWGPLGVPGLCLPFQDSPCRALPHPTILEALNYPSVPYAFDHADLSLENALPLLSAHEVLE